MARTNATNPTTGEKAFLQPGQAPTNGFVLDTPVAPVATPTAIPVSTLTGPATPITVPPAPQSTPSMVPSVTIPTGTTVDANGNATITPPTTPTQTEPSNVSDWLKTQFKALGEKLGTKADVTTQLQNDTALADKTTQATVDYNAYVKAKTDAAQQLEAMQTAEANTNGAVGGGYSSSIQDFQRKSNANIANLAIVAQASQGLLTAAQQTIKDKLDAQFQPVEDQIDFLTKFAAVNNNDLTDSEKFQLQEKADQKKTDLSNLTKTADDLHQNMLQNGAPASAFSAIDRITNDYVAGKITGPEAQTKMYQVAGNYGVDTYKQAQTQKLLSDIAATGDSDPTQTLAYAQQYASTGQIPTGLPKGTFGIVAQTAKELPKPTGTLVDINTGVKPSKLSSTQTDGIVALKDLSQKLTEAQDLFKTLSTGIVAGAAKSIFPTQGQQQYDALRSEIVDLLARARTGAAINASEEALYLGKIPGKFNNSLFVGSTGDNKIQGLKDSIDGKLNTNLKTNSLAIYGYSKVKIGDQEYTVGDLVSNGSKTGRVNPDGTITVISE